MESWDELSGKRWDVWDDGWECGNWIHSRSDDTEDHPEGDWCFLNLILFMDRVLRSRETISSCN